MLCPSTSQEVGKGRYGVQTSKQPGAKRLVPRCTPPRTDPPGRERAGVADDTLHPEPSSRGLSAGETPRPGCGRTPASWVWTPPPLPGGRGERDGQSSCPGSFQMHCPKPQRGPSGCLAIPQSGLSPLPGHDVTTLQPLPQNSRIASPFPIVSSRVSEKTNATKPPRPLHQDPPPHLPPPVSAATAVPSPVTANWPRSRQGQNVRLCTRPECGPSDPTRCPLHPVTRTVPAFNRCWRDARRSGP